MKSLANIFRRKPDLEDEVDEELRFHIDMQTHDYEKRGWSPEESHAMSEKRFGDVDRIRKECVRIGSGKTVLIWALINVFLSSLLIGFLLRILIPESHVNRVGDVMMMIGGLGILLVYAKTAGRTVFTSNAKPFQLGLNQNSPPVGFDEQGRTPFDRVRSEE